MQVEFNKAAQSLTDAIIPAAQKKLALNRLVKVQPAWKLQIYFAFFMFSRYLTSSDSANNLYAMQDNIALIAVLEAKFGNHGTENPSKRQLLCVVSAPFYWS